MWLRCASLTLQSTYQFAVLYTYILKELLTTPHTATPHLPPQEDLSRLSPSSYQAMWQGFATSAFGGQTCGMLAGHMAAALGMLGPGQDHKSMGLQVGVGGVAATGAI